MAVVSSVIKSASYMSRVKLLVVWVFNIGFLCLFKELNRKGILTNINKLVKGFCEKICLFVIRENRQVKLPVLISKTGYKFIKIFSNLNAGEHLEFE